MHVLAELNAMTGDLTCATASRRQVNTIMAWIQHAEACTQAARDAGFPPGQSRRSGEDSLTYRSWQDHSRAIIAEFRDQSRLADAVAVEREHQAAEHAAAAASMEGEAARLEAAAARATDRNEAAALMSQAAAARAGAAEQRKLQAEATAGAARAAEWATSAAFCAEFGEGILKIEATIVGGVLSALSAFKDPADAGTVTAHHQ